MTHLIDALRTPEAPMPVVLNINDKTYEEISRISDDLRLCPSDVVTLAVDTLVGPLVANNPPTCAPANDASSDRDWLLRARAVFSDVDGSYDTDDAAMDRINAAIEAEASRILQSTEGRSRPADPTATPERKPPAPPAPDPVPVDRVGRDYGPF
jgi:hypothetical protein